ncbi:unnamed protein product [Ranitomeya imitator]|uniref:Longin domain-containing protein n=1 Tax=Ranitomeya imitator TaxID=111125 RepID=A0ABN9L6K3_9NEOB|nr:unnamed protein product [Ranitomeya imitator]
MVTNISAPSMQRAGHVTYEAERGLNRRRRPGRDGAEEFIKSSTVKEFGMQLVSIPGVEIMGAPNPEGPGHRGSVIDHTLLEMSVILFASVVRARDGLPLSASTDHEQNMSVQETKKYLKVLSRKLEQLPDRCTMKRGPHHVHFISSLGVSYMMLCSEHYPGVLAFCFLDELQREFISTYEMGHVNAAIRPYSFIEFGLGHLFRVHGLCLGMSWSGLDSWKHMVRPWTEGLCLGMSWSGLDSWKHMVRPWTEGLCVGMSWSGLDSWKHMVRPWTEGLCLGMSWSGLDSWKHMVRPWTEGLCVGMS